MPNRYWRDLTKNLKPDTEGGKKGKGKTQEPSGSLVTDSPTFNDMTKETEMNKDVDRKV